MQRKRINLIEEEKAFVPFCHGKGSFHVSHLNFIKIQEHFLFLGRKKNERRKREIVDKRRKMN